MFYHNKAFLFCLPKRCYKQIGSGSTSVSDPYSSNPDPAKNLNPDPERPWIRILAISLHYLKKNLNYFIIISFYHQKKSIKKRML